MKYQIDQSGKIEQTERHTVLACTNSEEITILLTKREKRKLQKIFRITNSSKLFPLLVFAALLAVLIKKLNPRQKIIVDREYAGHEGLVEEKATIYLQQLRIGFMPLIEFGHIGKLSNPHKLAYLVAVGKKKPTIIVSANEVMKVILGIKKDRDRLTQD